MLIPSLVPLTALGTGEGVDLASHVGGGVLGASIGLALFWRFAVTTRPRAAELVGRALGLLGVALLAASAYGVRARYGRHALARFLIPERELPHGVEEIRADADRLVREYPRDPRARLFRALSAMDARDAELAEHQLRAALEDRPMLASFSPEFEARVRTFLTQTLLSQGKASAARDAAQPLCNQGPGAVPEAWRQQGLCPPKAP
jgi:hypothetical protein